MAYLVNKDHALMVASGLEILPMKILVQGCGSDVPVAPANNMDHMSCSTIHFLQRVNVLFLIGVPDTETIF